MGAAPPPPIGPDVFEQANPQEARSVFAAQGLGQPQPGMEGIQAIKQWLQKLEELLKDGLTLTEQIHPPLKAILGPMAKAGEEMTKQVEEIAKKSGMAQGSPMVPPPSAPPNPAAGPPAQQQ